MQDFQGQLDEELRAVSGHPSCATAPWRCDVGCVVLCRWPCILTGFSLKRGTTSPGVGSSTS
eukprot:9299527-Lingulodinium_polyedra.AAC.1